MAMRREREVEFSQPVRQVLFMVAVLIGAAVVGWLLYEPIEVILRANLYLNGLILLVFAVGVFACFRSVYQTIAAVSWIEGFAADRPGHEFAEPPRMLTSLANMLREGRARTSLSATAARTILDSVAIRLDESRDVTRYLGNLLIFLGLLGTFWGLSTTVPAVVDTIRSLAPGEEGGAAASFDMLMAGLEDQLGGMGTAFASSLLGLAGSLVVGLLELFVGHAHNRFFNELEEWFSTITRLGGAEKVAGDDDMGAADRNAAQIDALAQLMERSEHGRAGFETRLGELTETVSRLAGEVAAARGEEGAAARGAAERQSAALESIAERLNGASRETSGFDDEEGDLRDRLRSIDRHMLRLIDEVASGRDEAVAELRAELNQLSRAVIQLAEQSGARR